MRDQGLDQAIRAAGGITELARRIGISQPSVSNWERIPASTASTRSAGMRSQLETEGCEMPMRRASSVMPPAARIAWSSP
jgi:DNA-binding transcriptional regulator YdaS (Cro superfamily)